MTAALLAATPQEPLTKLIVGVVVAAVWIGVQAYGALTKKPDKQTPPSRRRPTPPVLSSPAPQRVGGPKPQRPQRRLPAVRAAPLRPAEVMRLPRPPMAASSIAETASRPMARSQMLGALLRPRDLKRAFVLTELLGPPLALRPPTNERVGR